jgi:hypothetical protein
VGPRPSGDECSSERLLGLTGCCISQAVSEEFGIPIDEEGLARRECDLIDLDGNRLRVATRRS